MERKEKGKGKEGKEEKKGIEKEGEKEADVPIFGTYRTKK